MNRKITNLKLGLNFANQTGLTITELMVVIGIMVILLVATLPIYGRLQASVRLNESGAQLVQALRLARERSVTGYNNAHHGVYLETNSAAADRYIIFQGNDYASRAASYDRIVELPNGLNFSFVGLTLLNGDDAQINFSSGLGQPDNVGTIMLSHNSGQNYAVTINGLGLAQEP